MNDDQRNSSTGTVAVCSLNFCCRYLGLVELGGCSLVVGSWVILIGAHRIHYLFISCM